MVRINVPVAVETWRRLRDLAELERTQGPASVSRVIRRIVEAHLKQEHTVEARRA